MGASKFFTGYRAMLKARDAARMRFATSYVAEISSNLALYTGADYVRGQVSWGNTASNLAWALLPAFLDTSSARSALQWIPNKLK